MHLTKKQIEDQGLTIYFNISKDPTVTKYRPVRFPVEVNGNTFTHFKVVEMSKDELIKPIKPDLSGQAPEPETQTELVTVTGDFYVIDSAGKQIYSSKTDL